MTNVSVGMVGCGFVAELHRYAYKRVYGVEAAVTAVAARGEHVVNFARKHGIATRSNICLEEEWTRGYLQEIQDFMECVAHGREPLSGPLLAYETIKVNYAAYWAAEEGRRVTLNALACRDLPRGDDSLSALKRAGAKRYCVSKHSTID